MKAYVIKQAGKYLRVSDETLVSNACKATLYFNKKAAMHDCFDDERVVTVDVNVAETPNA